MKWELEISLVSVHQILDFHMCSLSRALYVCEGPGLQLKL